MIADDQGMGAAPGAVAGALAMGTADAPSQVVAPADGASLEQVDADLAAAKARVAELEQTRAKLTADIRGGNGTVRLVLVATTPSDDLSWINGAPAGTLWMQTQLGPEQSSDQETTEAAARALAWPLMRAIGRTQR